MPVQKAKGIKGAKVVIVPVSTGKNTSPAAILAAVLISRLPLANNR